MECLALLLLLPGMLQMAVSEDYEFVTDSFNITEDPSFVFINDTSEEIPGEIQGVRLAQYQSSSSLRVYKGPLPRLPGTTASPWIALHSPVKMYIPIRNTGENSAESEDCVQCPRNLIIQLPPLQKYILMPVPTISLCSSFALQSGRVHVAVISGPRPGQLLAIGRYEVELVVWKAEGPVHPCKYTILVRGKRHGSTPTRYHVHNVPCPKPVEPSNGILLCVPSGKKYYPHNSVCQFFCLDNYLVKNTTTNSSTIICKNGRWSPYDHVTCVAAFCPKLPSPPAHGSWNCNIEESDAGFNEDTHCKVSCAPGFVVQTSQIENTAIFCIPPIWKSSKRIPECERAHLPKLQHCHNRHMIVRTGHIVKISDHLLPKGTTHSGVVLSPVCSLQGRNMPRGKHQNICEVRDPELRTRRKCSYIIHIEESSGPRPHADDCKNRTVLANRKGTIHSKPVRFLVKIGKPERTQIIRGKCTPRGQLRVGNHFILCKAINPHTGSIETCSYWLKVEERTCPPLRPIPNGRIECASRTSGSVCRYECNAGYNIPDSQLIRATKTCQANHRWHPVWDPICEIEPPTLQGGCHDMEINMSSPVQIFVPQPRFLTALNETLNASCAPSILSTPGYHRVECKIDDDLFNVSCQFSISVISDDQLTTKLPFTVQPLELVEGCNNLELNASASFNFTIPLPRYLTSKNEMLVASCEPPFITTVGQHQVKCLIDSITLNEICLFNVTIRLEDEQLLSQIFKSPELVEGCSDLELNASAPFNFTVPLPRYLTSQNETLFPSCEPSFIATVGQHQVKCLIHNVTLSELCFFNVTILLEDEQIPVLSPEIVKSPELVEGCNNLELNASSLFNFTIPLPRYLTSQNETLFASCEPSFIVTVGQHQVKCLIHNVTLSELCLFNVTILLEDEPVPVLSPEIVQSPELVEGCDDLEVNVSSAFNFTIPLPRYLTPQNETLFISCEPSFIITVGHYQVKCLIDNVTLTDFCLFNITILLEDEPISVPSSERVEPPKLVEGCSDRKVNMSSPLNFTVPLPQYLTSQNETLVASCEPSFITADGEHRVKCSTDNVIVAEFCFFNITIFLEDESIKLQSPEEAESPELVEGCSDLEINVSLPINFTVPLPQYLTSQNKTLIAFCEPSFITTVGQHHVKCSVDNLILNDFCYFNVTVLLEELVSLPYPERIETPKLVKGCNDLEVNVSPPFNFSVPPPRYLTAQNETLVASCQPSFITALGRYRVKCSVDNGFCHFNVTVSLDEPVTTPSPQTDSCKPLSSPLHGSMQCSTRGQTETCVVTCDPGYGFSDDYSFTAICDDSPDGLWDFQRLNGSRTLPECFAQVEGSAVEVWISFEAFAPHCEEELQDQVKNIIIDLCQLDTNCSKIIINCTLDEESDMMLVTVNWTVQADFNSDEYLDDEEIPEAETRLETVLERARAFLTTEDAPNGLHLFRDSFRRGLMTLVCPNGFAPDLMMANCVQCPMENSHCK